MNSVQEVNKQSFATTNTTTAADKNKNSIENPQDRFLKLLVTQMQNQDPLNPLDNAEVTSQLAQISTVTGIDKLNDTLQLLLDGIEDSRTMEAANLIGHKALVPGSTLSLENNAAIGGFELPQSVDKLSITILDSSGIAVRTLDLGAQPSGVNTFIWNGIAESGTNAANGQYSFSIKAVQGDQEITTSPLALGQVNSVSPGEHDAVLDMGKLGLVGMADIKQIF
ncbi:flagellar hook assembly protein FlgD [Nitrosomonas sp.]|uniref:flagellar hook assembly protein FlgD n=1 Tax=Nitrosomonas sp. TaxID=42353 RepID=UPI001D5A00AD|nr:flagellar hook assembly protein FlgD [Nitrosomonas sp.]MCB1947547.1 flagellar hook assembly protein FlgD [Nitrosomonas sp.]MCP5244208.1 flagellar hook assembly protein FlgD [Burkholderiales bacterium]MDR4515260.1 flagellar hook assembly protein FlgD [Nitrosomonas sp.]